MSRVSELAARSRQHRSWLVQLSTHVRAPEGQLIASGTDDWRTDPAYLALHSAHESWLDGWESLLEEAPDVDSQRLLLDLVVRRQQRFALLSDSFARRVCLLAFGHESPSPAQMVPLLGANYVEALMRDWSLDHDYREPNRSIAMRRRKRKARDERAALFVALTRRPDRALDIRAMRRLWWELVDAWATWVLKDSVGPPPLLDKWPESWFAFREWLAEHQDAVDRDGLVNTELLDHRAIKVIIARRRYPRLDSWGAQERALAARPHETSILPRRQRGRSSAPASSGNSGTSRVLRLLPHATA